MVAKQFGGEKVIRDVGTGECDILYGWMQKHYSTSAENKRFVAISMSMKNNCRSLINTFIKTHAKYLTESPMEDLRTGLK